MMVAERPSVTKQRPL